MIEPRIEQFLAERVRDVAYNSAGDLLRHLKNTHDLLEAWGNPPSVCLAGLFHSIYGTCRVSHKAMGFGERETLRALIGEEAEQLVYIFCVTERPKDFLECLDRHEVELRDHRTGTMMVLPRATLDRLLEIEVANILEQDERYYAVLDQCLRAWLTPGAIAAAEAYIKEGRQAAAL